MTNESGPPDEGVDARSAPTPAQDAALEQLAAGKGTPLALAKVLRPAAHLLETWPLPDIPLVRTVRGLVQLSDVILTDVETGGTRLDHAEFLGHYAQRVAFDGPERRAYFHERAIAELKLLDAERTEQCGSLSRLLATAASPHRCQQCFERPIKQCELRVVEEVAGTILNEQNAERRRLDCERIGNESYWPRLTVLSWIAFRDVARLCEIQDAGSLRRLKWYEQTSAKEANPERALITALKNDELRASRNGEELKAVYWADKNEVDSDALFRRTSVRRCWPGPREWNGFHDAFWSLGQMILWSVTRDPDDVDQASDDAGLVGARSGYGGFAAAVRLEELLQGQREQVEDAANDLRRRCQRTELKAWSGQDLIPATAWIDLKIEFEADGVPFVQRVGQRTRDPAYDNIRFSRAEALDVFKPTKTLEELNLRPQLRTQRANEFNRKQDCIALGKRHWLRLTEVANEYARKRGSLAIDSEERERALEVLRCSILTGEFVDKQGRSRVLNMHPSPLADFRFEPLGASNPEQFNPIAEHLWITHQDCVDWFNRYGLDLPLRMQRKPSSMARPERTRAEPAMVAVGEAIDGGVNGAEAVPASEARPERTSEDDQGGDHEDNASAQLPRRKRLPERPLSKKGRATAKTAAWDTIGLHETWVIDGIPLHWSEEEAGKNVSAHFRKLINHNKLNPDDYDHLRFNLAGDHEISADSVDRALLPRRPRRN